MKRLFYVETPLGSSRVMSEKDALEYYERYTTSKWTRPCNGQVIEMKEVVPVVGKRHVIVGTEPEIGFF
mgnify:CR=1 FL=1